MKANPTALLGSNALPSQFLVPHIGFANSIAEHDFGGKANYNALQVNLNRRFAKGLFFGGACTWSKCIDVGDVPQAVSNPFTRALFNNWQISGFTSLFSGTPVGVGFSIPSVGSPRITGCGARTAIRCLQRVQPQPIQRVQQHHKLLGADEPAGRLVNLFGFGTVSGVRPPRILQPVARFVF